MNRLRVIGTAILKRHGFFSADQIGKETGVSSKYLTDVLCVFRQEGLIKKITKGRKEHVPGESPRFSVIHRVIDRNKLASRIAPKLKERTVQDRMWSVIRNKSKVCGRFNLHDLVILGEVKKGTARWYLKALRQAGYIAQVGRASRGGLWGLTGKYSGPERPYPEYRPKKKIEAGIKPSKMAPSEIKKGR